MKNSILDISQKQDELKSERLLMKKNKQFHLKRTLMPTLNL